MKRELTPFLARLAAERIARVAVGELRALTSHEAGAVAALREIAGIPLPAPPASPIRSDEPIPFAPGDPVSFRTGGRGGLSPWRSGRVVEAHRTTRGVRVVVQEEGAGPGVIISTHAALVRTR